MIPSRSHEINGSRPSPLKLRYGSHSIRKTTSSNVVKPQQPRQPVIIYAHSPKVIHTHAQDFMALVQRLTGLSRSEPDEDNGPEREIRRNTNDDNESSSVVTEEANGFSNHNTTAPFSPEKGTNQQYLADIPLFTPSSMALFDSPNPHSVFRHTEPALYLSPDRFNSVSPSVFKFMKEFP